MKHTSYCNTPQFIIIDPAKVFRQLSKSVTAQSLTDCLETLENVGYTEERALLMLAYIQIGGVA